MLNKIKKYKVVGPSLFLLLGYPELKKQYYDNIKPASEPPSFHIQRQKVKLTNKQEKELEEEFEQCGFDYFDVDGFEWSSFINFWNPEYYWINNRKYEFTDQATDELIKATYNIHSMCLETIEFVMEHPELLTTAFQIPPNLHYWVIKSWKEQQKDLIARFDFLYTEQEGYKFIEANADTPTVLIEAGLAQEIWAEQTGHKQFNILSQSIHNGWKQVLGGKKFDNLVGLSHGVIEDSNFTETEDRCNTRYLINLADSVFNPENIHLEDISQIDQILNIQNQPFQNSKFIGKTAIWKLYPYEWLATESSGIYFSGQKENKDVQMLEPAWKLLMANKAILPIMYALYPNNEYLLPSYFTVNRQNECQYLNLRESIGKRIYGREGKTIKLGQNFPHDQQLKFVEESGKVGNQTSHGEINKTLGRPIFQQFLETTKYRGRSTTIGSWVVYGLPAGIGMREDISNITSNISTFVPHSVIELDSDIQQQQQIQNDNFIDQKLVQNQNQENNSNNQNVYSDDFNNMNKQLIEDNDSDIIYAPKCDFNRQNNDPIFHSSQQQWDLRQRLYGKNNKVEEIYEHTPFEVSNIKLGVRDQNLSQEQKQKAIFSINQQLVHYNQYLFDIEEQRKKEQEERDRRKNEERNRHHSSVFYGGGNNTNNGGVKSSSANQAGKSYSSRQRTGSSGKSFSTSS